MVETRRRRANRRAAAQVDQDMDSTEFPDSSTLIRKPVSEDDAENCEKVIRMETDDDDVHDTFAQTRNDNNTNMEQKMKSIHQINQEAERICEIIQKYEKQIPKDDDRYNNNNNEEEEDNIWYSQPQQIFQELEDAQSQLQEAWSSHTDSKSNDNIKGLSFNDSVDENDEVIGFREAYMELMTCAFEEELDAIRKGRILQPSINHKKKKETSSQSNNNEIMKTENPDESETVEENVDIDVLIDFLQSGKDIWTKEERILFLEQKTTANIKIEDKVETRNQKEMESRKNITTPHERRRQFLFGSQN